jgi:transposase
MKSTSPSQKRPAYFCGIDVAKNRHVACVLDGDGTFRVRSQSFANSAAGFEQLRERLKPLGGPGQVVVALEATGHYWFSLRDHLVEHGYEVAVLNPLQTAQQAKKGIRKAKTDRIDARHIATLLKNGDYKPALVPGPFATQCRQLTRLRYTLIRQRSRIKQRLWAYLHPVWPEYEALFPNPFCRTGCKLLALAPTPADVLALQAETLGELIRKTSRGKYGAVQAEKVRQAAEGSISARRCVEGARPAIRLLLTQLDYQAELRQQLELQIAPLADRVPAYLLTLPGAEAISAVSLFGETDPIETFRSPEQLVAFAGLDLVVSESGEYQAPRRRISKRGSPVLRYTLWSMAHRACYKEGELRDYWLRKKAQGLHHLAAVTAVAVKLTRVAWRILTDRRDSLPQPPAKKH